MTRRVRTRRMATTSPNKTVPATSETEANDQPSSTSSTSSTSSPPQPSSSASSSNAFIPVPQPPPPSSSSSSSSKEGPSPLTIPTPQPPTSSSSSSSSSSNPSEVVNDQQNQSQQSHEEPSTVTAPTTAGLSQEDAERLHEMASAQQRKAELSADGAYYRILNVGPEATTEQIKAAYKKLVMTYHPDKFPVDPDEPASLALRAHAAIKFNEVTEAYNTLVDPTKRAVYDMYGTEGLGIGMELGPVLKTPHQIREEFQRMKKKEAQLELDLKSTMRGTLIYAVSLDHRLNPSRRAARAKAAANPSAVTFGNNVVTLPPVLQAISAGSTPPTESGSPVHPLAGPVRELGEIPEDKKSSVMDSATQKDALDATPSSSGFSLQEALQAPLAKVRNIVSRFGDEPLYLMQHLGVMQKGEAPISKKNTLFGGGTIVMRRGAGGGHFSLGIRRVFSPNSSGEFSFLTGARSGLEWSLRRKLTAHTDGTLSGSYDASTGVPSLTVAAERQLTAHTSGTLSWTLGDDAGIGLDIERQGRRSALACGLKMGLSNDVHVNYTRQVSRRTFYRTAVSVGLSNTELEIAGGRKISDSSTGYMGVAFTPAGIFWRLGVSRAGQRVNIPVLLSSEYSRELIIGAVGVPVALATLARLSFIAPNKARRSARKLAELREQHAESVRVARLDAARDIRIMTRAVLRKVTTERARGGIIILEAVYGNLGEWQTARARTGEQTPTSASDSWTPTTPRGGAAPTTPSAADGDRKHEFPEGSPSFQLWADVKIPVQYLVERSELHMHYGASKSVLLGFYDPCPGEEKALYIRYLFKGRVHEVTVDDTEALSMPLQAHLVDE